MIKVLDAFQDEIKYNHVPYLQRFFMFVWRKRIRFSGVILLASTFTLWGNMIIFISAKIERTFKHYKR
jgi:hypothetical protein